eukprot:364224-Prymnesium_polylepis.1
MEARRLYGLAAAQWHVEAQRAVKEHNARARHAVKAVETSRRRTEREAQAAKDKAERERVAQEQAAEPSCRTGTPRPHFCCPACIPLHPTNRGSALVSTTTG